MKSIRRTERLTPGSIYLDTDSDGLTDRVEREIGTGPLKRDTNGAGIADGRNNDLTYRPYPLSDDERILQAAVEALSQSFRLASMNAHQSPNLAPRLYSDRDSPMVLLVPAGSKGVNIRSHNGAIICRPFDPGQRVLPNRGPFGGAFTPPEIGLDGRRIHDPLNSALQSAIGDGWNDSGEYYPFGSDIPRLPGSQASGTSCRASGRMTAR